MYLLHVTLPCGLIRIGTQTEQDAIVSLLFCSLSSASKTCQSVQPGTIVVQQHKMFERCDMHSQNQK
ncbi:hypothetical protein AH4AK4_3082 [Aeromonas hydrophila 4AK4]|nr:hypothetical protein AH4AK4_3082 [Aeromonas hydrophila 4AK4]